LARLYIFQKMRLPRRSLVARRLGNRCVINPRFRSTRQFLNVEAWRPGAQGRLALGRHPQCLVGTISNYDKTMSLKGTLLDRFSHTKDIGAVL
jgi:hypothetical protein